MGSPWEGRGRHRHHLSDSSEIGDFAQPRGGIQRSQRLSRQERVSLSVYSQRPALIPIILKMDNSIFMGM